MVKVAAEINVPVATGERLYTKFGFRELLAKQAADIIQPDVCHTGGILETKKIAAMAEAYYVPIAPHNPFGPINTAAAIQVDACTPNFLIQEMILRHLPTYRQILTEPLEPRRRLPGDPDAAGHRLRAERGVLRPPVTAIPDGPHPNPLPEGEGEGAVVEGGAHGDHRADPVAAQAIVGARPPRGHRGSALHLAVPARLPDLHGVPDDRLALPQLHQVQHHHRADVDRAGELPGGVLPGRALLGLAPADGSTSRCWSCRSACSARWARRCCSTRATRARRSSGPSSSCPRSRRSSPRRCSGSGSSSRRIGVLNYLLSLVGIQGPPWLQSTHLGDPVAGDHRALGHASAAAG